MGAVVREVPKGRSNHALEFSETSVSLWSN